MTQRCALWAVFVCEVRLTRDSSAIFQFTFHLFIYLSISISLTRPRGRKTHSNVKRWLILYLPSSRAPKYHTTYSYASLSDLSPPQSAPISRTQYIGVSLPHQPTFVLSPPPPQTVDSWTPSYVVIRHGLMTTNYACSVSQNGLRIR